MFFALCRFELFIPQGRSLKGKRSVLVGVKERLRSRFHASVIEVGGQDLHQRGTLGVALVGASPVSLEAALAAMRRLVEQEDRCSIMTWETRVEPFEGAPREPRDALLHGAGGGTAGDRAAGDRAQHWDEHEEGDEYFGPTWDHKGEG